MSEAVPETMSRCIKINDWIFEVKMVRAIRAEEYGQPYSAIANINFNGESAFVDGLMTNSEVEFTREDFKSFKRYFQQIGVEQVQFDRYKKQEAIARSYKKDQDTTPSLEMPPEEDVLPTPLHLVNNG